MVARSLLLAQTKCLRGRRFGDELLEGGGAGSRSPHTLLLGAPRPSPGAAEPAAAPRKAPAGTGAGLRPPPRTPRPARLGPARPGTPGPPRGEAPSPARGSGRRGRGALPPPAARPARGRDAPRSRGARFPSLAPLFPQKPPQKQRVSEAVPSGGGHGPRGRNSPRPPPSPSPSPPSPAARRPRPAHLPPAGPKPLPA